MKMTNEQYKQYAERHAPRTNSRKNMLFAFLIGGAICCLGQLIIQLLISAGIDKETASTCCSVFLVFMGALLTGFGVYDNIARIAGAGTLVPITGFANSVVAPALEFKTEGFVTGTGAKMFVIAGPVIVYGISASVIYGIIYWVVQMIFA